MIELKRAALQAHLAEGKRVRRTLEPWGRLHLDRSLPFLCLYRRPREGAVEGFESLLTSEACYLYAEEPEESLQPLRALLSEVTSALTAAEGPSLLLELWLGPPPEDALPRGPRFTIVTGPRSPEVDISSVSRSGQLMSDLGGKKRAKWLQGGMKSSSKMTENERIAMMAGSGSGCFGPGFD